MKKTSQPKKDFRKGAKVLLIDLEVSPTLMWAYGQYETHSVKVMHPPILLSVAWKWLGESKTHCETLYDDKTPDKWDDSMLVRQLWHLMDDCNIFVSHNVKFDEKMANAFFLRHGMPRPSWYKTFCTLQTARRFFKLDNNKLDYLGKLLCGEGKTESTYADCWEDLLYGDEKRQKNASEVMKKYNKQDVDLLEKIYNKLLPFADNHPNMALAVGRPEICPRCGFRSTFKIKAYRKTQNSINAVQYQCRHCKAYVTRKLTKDERDNLDFHNLRQSEYRNQVY